MEKEPYYELLKLIESSNHSIIKAVWVLSNCWEYIFTCLGVITTQRVQTGDDTDGGENNIQSLGGSWGLDSKWLWVNRSVNQKSWRQLGPTFQVVMSKQVN